MKKIISSRLIRFALKENWLTALITAVGMSLIGAFFSTLYIGLDTGVHILDIADVGALIKYLPYAVVFLTARAFGFYMKRSDADFFEALPYTRTQILFSISCATSMLSAGMLIVSALTSMIVSADHLKDAIFLWGDSLLLLLAYFIACQIAIFATVIAVSITGHAVNANIAAFLILLTPRTVIDTIAFIAESSPITAGTNAVFMNKYNLFTYMPDTVPSLSAYIYSLIIAIFLCAVAIALFNRRRSEIVSHFYANSIVGHVLRTAVSLSLSLSVAVSILNIGEVSAAESAGTIIFETLILLCVYFGYELVAIRNKRAFLSALKGIPILVAVNLLIVSVAFGAGALIDAQVPDEDDISYVTIGEEVYDFGSYTLAEYVNLKGRDLLLDEPEAREIIARVLKENIEVYEADKYEQTYYYSKEEYRFITADIYTAGGKIRRNLALSQQDYETLAAMLIEREEYRALWTDLPTEPHSVYYEGSYFTLDNRESTQVYEAILRDLDKMTFREWYEANQEFGADEIVVVARYGGKPLKLRIPVTEKTPEAYALMNRLLDEKAEEAYGGLVSRIRSAAQGSAESIEVNLCVALDDTFYHGWFTVDSSETGRSIADFIISGMTADRSLESSFIEIGVFEYSEIDYYAFALSDSITIDYIKQFFDEEIDY